MNRRAFLFGAPAVAVAPLPAAALPARLLDYIPCDGRELPICDYYELFEAIKDTCSWSMATQTFRVPDTREFAAKHPIYAGGVIPLDDVISTGRDGRVPAGRILLMEPR